WLNRDPRGFRIVDVTAGAPAQAAGLRPGDVITSVDGKPSTSIALPDLRYRLRNDAPGTVVRFSVMRGTKTKQAAITLRDLI
ncbi:MAG: PDZ domain-containing protein, partial [Alphaproteobacteria bacterium]|nr:PDZ domain-containing protein [Alphaproteobacteria bacterium]